VNAVLTCNIGGIDDLKPMVNQIAPTCYFAFTEKNLPLPLPNLNDRLKGKYLKINTHRFLPEYSNYIWIDGRVEVLSMDFVRMMSEHLKNHDVVICTHDQRSNVYEEIHFIQDLMKQGNKYLLARYKEEPFEEELDFYRSEGLPEDYPLYACTVFARRNDAKVNFAFSDWFLRSLEFTCFDQCMFSYIVWRYNLKVKALPYEELLKYVTIGKHKAVK
jgi:hypothetical protein